MTDNNKKKLSIFLIVLHSAILIALFIAVLGPWYQIEVFVTGSYDTKNLYDLYKVSLQDSILGLYEESFYIKDMDTSISKVFVSIGVFQWLTIVFFLGGSITLIKSLYHPKSMTTLNVYRGFTISTYTFQLCATFILFAFNPAFRDTIGTCDYSRSPCYSFFGSVSTDVSDMYWRPAYGWIASVFSSFLTAIVVIATIKRHNILKKEIQFNNYSAGEGEPFIRNY